MNFYSLPGIVGFLKKLNLLYYEQALFTFLLDLTQQDINARDDPGSQEGGPKRVDGKYGFNDFKCSILKVVSTFSM